MPLTVLAIDVVASGAASVSVSVCGGVGAVALLLLLLHNLAGSFQVSLLCQFQLRLFPLLLMNMNHHGNTNRNTTDC